MELRFLCLLLCFPLLGWLSKRQEFAADKYASDAGFGKQLIEFLKVDCEEGFFHPSHEQRRKKLEQYEQIRLGSVTA